MEVYDWLRNHLFPMTPAEAQRRVDAIDIELAQFRAQVAAMPAEQREEHAQKIRALTSEHAQARNVLSDMLDERAKR